jgi:WD40 repeat protein
VKKTFVLVVFVFLVLVISACASATAAPASTPTQLPTGTSSPTPTFTPMPTATATVTPTPQLPVLMLTPVPLVDNIVDVGNAANVRELARYWGNPKAISRVSSDETRVVVANVEGIYLYDADTHELVNRFDYRIYFFHYTECFSPLMEASDYLSISTHGDRIAFVADDLSVNVINDQGEKIFVNQLPPSKDLYRDMTVGFYLQISSDGKTLYVLYQNQRYLYDLDNNKKIEVPEIEKADVRDAIFSENGEYLILKDKSENIFYSYSTDNWTELGKIIPQMPNPSTWGVTGNILAFYNGNRAISNYCYPQPLHQNPGNSIEIWDFTNLKLLKTVTIPHVRSDSSGWDLDRIKLSKDGKYAILLAFTESQGGRTFAQVVNLQNGESQIIDSSTMDYPYLSQLQLLDVKADQIQTIEEGIYESSWPGINLWVHNFNSFNLPNFEFKKNADLPTIIISSGEDSWICQIDFLGKPDCPARVATMHSTSQPIFMNGEYFSYHWDDTSTDDQLVFQYYKGLLPDQSNLLGIVPNYAMWWYGQPPIYNLAEKNIAVYLRNDENRIGFGYIYNFSENRLIVKQRADWMQVLPDKDLVVFLVNSDTSDHLFVYDASSDEVQLIINKLYPIKNPVNYISYRTKDFPTGMNTSPDESKIILASPYEDKIKKTNGVRTTVIDIETPDTPVVFETPIDFLPTTTAAFFDTNPKYLGLRLQYNYPVLAVSPDNSMVVYGTQDGRLIFIDLKTGALLNQMQAHYDPIVTLTFSPDGKYIASYGRSGILKIWGVLP